MIECNITHAPFNIIYEIYMLSIRDFDLNFIYCTQFGIILYYSLSFLSYSRSYPSTTHTIINIARYRIDFITVVQLVYGLFFSVLQMVRFLSPDFSSYILINLIDCTVFNIIMYYYLFYILLLLYQNYIKSNNIQKYIEYTHRFMIFFLYEQKKIVTVIFGYRPTCDERFITF